MTELMTVQEVASVLKVSEYIAMRMLTDAKCPFISLGKGKGRGLRFHREGVEKFMRDRTVDNRPKKKAVKIPANPFAMTSSEFMANLN